MCGGVKDIRPSDPDPERIGKPRQRAATVPQMWGAEKPRTKGDKMKRITIPMKNVLAIIKDHIYEGFGTFEMLFGDKMPDVRMYMDEEGAHITIPNVKGEADK